VVSVALVLAAAASLLVGAAADRPALVALAGLLLVPLAARGLAAEWAARRAGPPARAYAAAAGGALAALTATALLGLGRHGWLVSPRYRLDGDLREGATVVQEFRMDMPEGMATVTGGGEAFEAPLSADLSQVTESEVLPAGPAGARRLRLTHVRDVSKFVTRAPREETENGPLHGRQVLCEESGGGWRRTLVGAPPDARQRRELALAWSFGDVYPARGVQVGESWSAEGAALRRLWGMGGTLSFRGSGEFRFERVAEHRGERCAVISGRVEIKARALDEEGREVEMELSYAGTAYRSLSSALDLDAEYVGEMRLNGTRVEEGLELRVVVTGPVRLSLSERRK
jgi:hypothetical protein